MFARDIFSGYSKRAVASLRGELQNVTLCTLDSISFLPNKPLDPEFHNRSLADCLQQFSRTQWDETPEKNPESNGWSIRPSQH